MNLIRNLLLGGKVCKRSQHLKITHPVLCMFSLSELLPTLMPIEKLYISNAL